MLMIFPPTATITLPQCTASRRRSSSLTATAEIDKWMRQRSSHPASSISYCELDNPNKIHWSLLPLHMVCMFLAPLILIEEALITKFICSALLVTASKIQWTTFFKLHVLHPYTSLGLIRNICYWTRPTWPYAGLTRTRLGLRPHVWLHGRALHVLQRHLCLFINRN